MNAPFISTPDAGTNPPLLPDIDGLERFYTAMFKHANPKGIVALRAFLDRTKDAPDGIKGTLDRPLIREPISITDPQFREVVFERAPGCKLG